MEHLMNCHGEWMWVLQILATIPFVGLWLKTYLSRRHDHKDDQR